MGMTGGLSPTLGMTNHLVICHGMRLQTENLTGWGHFTLPPVLMPSLIQKYSSNQTGLCYTRLGWPNEVLGFWGMGSGYGPMHSSRQQVPCTKHVHVHEAGPMAGPIQQAETYELLTLPRLGFISYYIGYRPRLSLRPADPVNLACS